MPPSKLYPYEWVLVALFSGSLVVLSLYSCFTAATEMPVVLGEEDWIRPPLVTLSITGAVHYPGDYQVRRGSSVGEALNKALPNLEADLSRLKLEAKVRQKQRIYVPLKKKRLRNIPQV